MPTVLTNTGINFDDGTTQSTATAMDFIQSVNAVSGATYIEFTGAYNANYRNKYRGLYISIAALVHNSSPGTRNLHLQMRWTDAAGNYGWATSSSTPYRYPVNHLLVRNGSISGYNNFNNNSVLIGRENANYSGSVQLLGLFGFGQDVLYHGYGTDNSGHTVTVGGGKVENRTDPPQSRVFDGFRIYWGGDTFASGAISVYGMRR